MPWIRNLLGAGWVRATALIWMAGVAGCDGGGDTDAGLVDAGPPVDSAVDGGAGSVTLRVGSWWASPSETEALQTVLARYSDETDNPIEFVRISQDQGERADELETMNLDVAQENAQSLSVYDGNDGPAVIDLTTIPELAAALETVPENVRRLLTVDGQVRGFPMNLHRENTLHYNLEYVDDPPETLEELRAMCDAWVASDPDPSARGPRPLAIGSADWIHRILLESLIPPAVLTGEVADPRPALVAALDLIDYYHENDCFYVVPAEHGWDQAAQALIDGEAMMYIHGDWAKGYMVQTGWEPGVDFDTAPAPGSGPGYLFTVDSFMINAGSRHLAETIDFAVLALRPDVQIAFSERKGSTPAVTYDSSVYSSDDPSLNESQAELEAAIEQDTFIGVPPWLANDSFASGDAFLTMWMGNQPISTGECSGSCGAGEVCEGGQCHIDCSSAACPTGSTCNAEMRCEAYVNPIWIGDQDRLAAVGRTALTSEEIAANFVCNRSFRPAANFGGLCSSDAVESTCTVNFDLDAQSCDDACSAMGRDCLAAMTNEEGPDGTLVCESLGASACGTVVTGTQLCVCEAL
jgi:glucose/mannose transport system substrate-binding protein